MFCNFFPSTYPHCEWFVKREAERRINCQFDRVSYSKYILPLWSYFNLFSSHSHFHLTFLQSFSDLFLSLGSFHDNSSQKKKKAPYHLVFLEKLGTFKQTNICGQTIATSIQYFVSPSWSNIFIDPQNELDVEWPSFFPFVLSLSRCWTTSVCPLLHTMIYNPTPVSNITFHTDNLYRTSSVAIVLTAPAVIVLTASASFALTASAATCIN